VVSLRAGAGAVSPLLPGENALSSRYARPSKPPKRRSIKLSRFQAIAAVATVLLVCTLIGGVAGSIILDSWGGGDGDSSQDAVVNSEELLQELRNSAEANPTNPEAQAALANYLANTGNFEESIPYYEQAIALDPANWVFRLDFAQSLMDNGKPADAFFQLDKILELDPQNSQAWYYRGQWLQSTGEPDDLDDAIFAYQQVIRYDPDSFIADQAVSALAALGVATPVASPAAVPAASPEGNA
jgi:tetratricopeptide (TPR) repeat protein